MIIIRENKQLSEDKKLKTFTVNYFGVKATYEIWQSWKGEFYCTGQDVHSAAKILAKKANELFFAALKKEGLPVVHPTGGTEDEFLPLGTYR